MLVAAGSKCITLKALVLRYREVSVDELVQRVVKQFAPTLERLAITTELTLDASQTVSLDEDVVEQILVNLISNVEKYAADGGLLKISTSRTATSVTIIVADAGPGIPIAMQHAVFEPFIRVSSRLEDPAELRAVRGEQTVELSLRDVQILELLHRNAGQVLDRNTIFNHSWGEDYFPNSRTLDQHISQLRKRIEVDPQRN